MTKTIKQQVEELDKIIDWFNSVDDFEIEQAIEKHQAAQQLLAAIKADLDQKRNQITEVK